MGSDGCAICIQAMRALALVGSMSQFMVRGRYSWDSCIFLLPLPALLPDPSRKVLSNDRPLFQPGFVYELNDTLVLLHHSAPQLVSATSMLSHEDWGG